MSSKKLVTSAQVESLRTMANAKGVSRKAFQVWLDDHASRILDFLKSETTTTDNSGLIIYPVMGVNRNQKPLDALKATGRNVYVDDGVVDTMPKGSDENKCIIFFKLGRNISDDDLEKEYELRGYIPVDPYSLAKFNQDNPVFADERPNGTHWKNAQSNWCFAIFRRCGGNRSVLVYCKNFVWDERWWFAGLRK